MLRSLSDFHMSLLIFFSSILINLLKKRNIIIKEPKMIIKIRNKDVVAKNKT